MFVVGSSPNSSEFDGVALWGPPCDDWLPWCALRTLRFPVPGVPLPLLAQGRGRVPVSVTARKERLDVPPRESPLSYLRNLNSFETPSANTIGDTKIRGAVQVCLWRMGVQRQHKQLAVKGGRRPTRVPTERSGKGVDGSGSTEGDVSLQTSFLANLNRTTFRVHRQGDQRAGASPSHVPTRYPFQPPGQLGYHLTRSHSQAATSNHKVVVDCHSQITVRELIRCCLLSIHLTDVFGTYLERSSTLRFISIASLILTPFAPVSHLWCRDNRNVVRNNFRLVSSAPAAFASTPSFLTSSKRPPSRHPLFAVCIRHTAGALYNPCNALHKIFTKMGFGIWPALSRPQWSRHAPTTCLCGRHS